MIAKEEIDAKSQELGVNTSDVQRDYIFGWLLSGIFGASRLQDTLILKGGNCFRKAYFENTRYSNDLDFSTQVEIDHGFLQSELNRVCEFVTARTGVTFALDKNVVRERELAGSEARLFEARVYFKGFYGEESHYIKVKLDVKEYDRIFLPLQTRNLIHPYSDAAVCSSRIICHKLEELLASKLKALLQRRHSPDLYDFVYAVFVQNALSVNRLEIVNTFLKKTIYEPDPPVARNLLLELPFQLLRAYWNEYLVCPKYSLMSFDEAENHFKTGIPVLFGLLSPRYATAGSYSLSYFSSNFRNLIMDAGKAQTLLEIVHDGFRRIVEPYALTYKVRKDGVGQEYFYAWDRTGGRSGPGIKAFIHNNITSLRKTEERFEPRYAIELSKAGESVSKTYFSSPFARGVTEGRHRNARAFSIETSYEIQCPICNKRFKRKTYDTRLNKHKDHYGNDCFGRTGFVVY